MKQRRSLSPVIQRYPPTKGKVQEWFAEFGSASAPRSRHWNQTKDEESEHGEATNWTASEWSDGEERAEAPLRSGRNEHLGDGVPRLLCARSLRVVRCALLWPTPARCCCSQPCSFLFISSSFPLLLFAITTTGAPHTQSFYTVGTTWGFPPTGRKIKIISHDVSHRAFIMATPPAEVAWFLLPLKWVLILFGVEWNDLLIHTSFICKWAQSRKEKKKKIVFGLWGIHFKRETFQFKTSIEVLLQNCRKIKNTSKSQLHQRYSMESASNTCMNE